MVEAQKQTGSKEEIPPSLLLPSHLWLVPPLGKTQTKPGGQRSSGIQSLGVSPPGHRAGWRVDLGRARERPTVLVFPGTVLS